MVLRANRDAFFERLKELNPKPTTELVYSSHFELLVAVMLSAQATDISVNKATKTLYQVANTPEQILALGEAGLKTHIRHIGLFNSKAKHIIQSCQQLISLHQGNVPDDRKALEALPGVGRKTANVVLNTAFGHPTIAVDTHIYRVANRCKLAVGKTPLAVEKALLRVVPADYCHDAHHWLILHGRYICRARQPLCYQCPVFDLCRYPQKQQYAENSE